MKNNGTVMKIRRRRQKRQMKMACLGILVLIIACWFSVRAAATANAGTKDSSRYKYYTSIQVEKGTSLWDIAGNYMTEEYGTEKEYIKEVMKMNHMNSSTVYEGAYLCVPYYSEEKK